MYQTLSSASYLRDEPGYEATNQLQTRLFTLKNNGIKDTWKMCLGCMQMETWRHITDTTDLFEWLTSFFIASLEMVCPQASLTGGFKSAEMIQVYFKRKCN